MEYTIQSLVFPKESKHLQCKELFYRGEEGYLDTQNGTLTLGYGQNVDFVTYLNACSYRKWINLTCAGELTLYLDIEGDCSVNYVGYSRELGSVIRKDYATVKQYGKRTYLKYTFPDNEQQMNGFELTALGKCTIYGGYFTVVCDESQMNEVNLCIAATTCKKEEFIKRNVELIKTSILDKDEEISKHLFFHVTDNGRTLSSDDIRGDHVFLHPNSNTGGAGGFARGMIESLHQTPEATHVLLMDDDVLILPESIRRTYHLLRLLKKRFREDFISGAMLYYEEPYQQHEDIGTITSECYFIPRKPQFDHRLIEQNLENEDDYLKQPNEYAGWWYCCIPTQVIKKNGLPLPIFIRCDDMEYSLRCKANIITMNGICIWHMGFVRKYNAAFDKYQQCRNLLIDKACSDIMKNVDVDAFVHKSFRVQILKYNYDAAELVLRGFRDFLKGPEFLLEDRGEAIVQENVKLNDKMMPLAEMKTEPIPNVFDCYYDPPRTFLNKWLLRATYNGHLFWPEALLKQKPALVAFDHTYQPEKMTLHKQHLEVNPYNQTGKLLTIDKKRFKVLMVKYNYLRKYYKAHRAEIIQKYRDQKAYITSETFWRKYLKLK